MDSGLRLVDTETISDLTDLNDQTKSAVTTQQLYES